MPPRPAKTRAKQTPAKSAKTNTSGNNSRGAAMSSVIDSLFQALRTARLEIPTAEAPTSAPTAHHDELVHHLATILHGAYLVTLVERAQLGTSVAAVVADEAGTQPRPNAPSDAPPVGAQSGSPAPVASTTIDDRWLSAVVQYCRFTVVLDDLAKVAEAFPDYLSVRWSLKPTHAPVSATLAAALDDQTTARTPSRSPGRKRQRGGAADWQRHNGTALSAGALVARLHVYRSSVPSVEEAVSALEATLKSKGATSAAQRAWRTHLSQLTAYGTFLQQHPLSSTASDAKTKKRARSQDDGDDSPPSASQETQATTRDLTAEEQSLLDELSPELRNALSRQKLHGVLSEMQRERARADANEDAEIHKRQVRERLVAVYEHVLALCGPKRRTFGAAQLLQTLRTESIYTEQRNAQEQLDLLLGTPESGITASTVTAKGVVVSVPSIGKLSTDELKSVLVNVDPESGSVQAVVRGLSDGNASTSSTAA